MHSRGRLLVIVLALAIIGSVLVARFVPFNDNDNDETTTTTSASPGLSRHELTARRLEAIQDSSRSLERELIKEKKAKERRIAARKEARQAERQAAREEAARQAAEAEAAQAAESAEAKAKPTGGLPSLLVSIRAHESGGNYSAYNAGGCEGYGCGGAYQLHARYASTWAARAGFSGLSSNAANWPAATQDKVALDLFYSTNPDGAHWCNWASYC